MFKASNRDDLNIGSSKQNKDIRISINISTTAVNIIKVTMITGQDNRTFVSNSHVTTNNDSSSGCQAGPLINMIRC